MKNTKFIKNILYMFAIVVLLCAAVLLIAGRFGIGGLRALVVQSGSMEPSISIKSVVFVFPTSHYNINDVITFRQSGRDNMLVTHRVQGVEYTPAGKEFITKGDANEEADGERVMERDIIGKVIFSLPFIGEIVSFAKTQIGFLALVIIPATVIVYSEILNIKKQIVKYLAFRRRTRLIRPFK